MQFRDEIPQTAGGSFKMSLASSSLPVPFLNHDILIHIFHINTETPERERSFRFVSDEEVEPISPLGTARRTSQVCRSWRQIILESSTVWANIIDLEYVFMGRDYFKEVIKRTGQAKLSIFGRITSLYQMQIFVSLLEDNWDRVRRLDVLVFKEELMQMGSQLWDIFWKRPAPNLEKFLLDVDEGHYYFSPNEWEDGNLFAGSAPLLRRVHSPLLRYDLRSPWISQLVSMDLSLSAPLNVIESLRLITRTPLLESLAIEIVDDNAYDEASLIPQTPKVSLPNLRRLDISTDIFNSHLYLSRITPRNDCALILAMEQSSTSFNDSVRDILRQLSKIIFRYAEGYFKVHHPTELNICIRTILIEISFDPDDEVVYFGQPQFKISLTRCLYFPFDHEVVNSMLSSILPSAFKTLNAFQFTLTHPSWCPSTDESIHIFQELASTSVKKLVLNPSALNALANLPDSTSTTSLIHSLTELTITYQSREKNLDQILRVFLHRLKDAGNPLETLYMPDNVHPRGDHHWIFLRDEFDRLRVVSTGDGDDDSESDDSRSWVASGSDSNLNMERVDSVRRDWDWEVDSNYGIEKMENW